MQLARSWPTSGILPALSGSKEPVCYEYHLSSIEEPVEIWIVIGLMPREKQRGGEGNVLSMVACSWYQLWGRRDLYTRVKTRRVLSHLCFDGSNEYQEGELLSQIRRVGRYASLLFARGQDGQSRHMRVYDTQSRRSPYSSIPDHPYPFIVDFPNQHRPPSLYKYKATRALVIMSPPVRQQLSSSTQDSTPTICSIPTIVPVMMFWRFNLSAEILSDQAIRSTRIPHRMTPTPVTNVSKRMGVLAYVYHGTYSSSLTPPFSRPTASIPESCGRLARQHWRMRYPRKKSVRYESAARE